MGSNLLTLHKELLSEIWSWLPDYDLKSVARVCKRLSSIWDNISRVEFQRVADQTEIQPLLEKYKFEKAQHFKIRANWKLTSNVTIEKSITTALRAKKLTSLDLDCRLFPNLEGLLREMTSLQHVCLYYKKLGDTNHTLDFETMFPNHPHLTSFSIQATDLVRVQGWQFVKNLRSLELHRGGEGVFFPPESYFEFPENILNNLTRLSIQFLCFESSEFKVLTNLVDLELHYVRIGDDFNRNQVLFDLPNLKILNWQNTQQLRESTIASAGLMTHLTKLFFLDDDDYFEYYNTSFHDVDHMTHLKQLAIIDRADVSALTNLEKLRLSHQAVESIKSAENLPKLVDLALTDTSLYEESQFVLTTLCNMTNLTKLVFYVRLRREDKTRPFLLDNFSKLINLRHLEIAPLEDHDKPERCGETINAISLITSLRILHLKNPEVASVPEMSKLTQLKLLKVSRNPQFDTCHIPLNVPVEYYSVADVDQLDS